MNLRTSLVLSLISGALFGAPSEVKPARAPVQIWDESSTFTLEEAQAIADSQRVALYGLCGMCVFKQNIGFLWIFETYIGYAGSKVADIRVIEPPKRPLKFDAKIQLANKSVDPTTTAVTPPAGQEARHQ